MKIKRLIATAMLGMVITTIGLPCGQVEAFSTTSITGNAQVIDKQEGLSTYAADTVWKYRTKNGKTQKRLWSIEKQKWLTDWQYV